jgi:hypothetical protein
MRRSPALVNDGSGADVSIPSFSIYKNIADKIKKELKKDQSVLLNSRVSERLRQFGSTRNRCEDKVNLDHVVLSLVYNAPTPTWTSPRTPTCAPSRSPLQEQVHFSPLLDSRPLRFSGVHTNKKM